MKKNIRQYDSLILEMYSKGYSSSYIADYLGVSKPGVIDRLRKYGVIHHKKRKNMVTIGYSLKEKDPEIISMYNEGYSMGYISNALDIKRTSIFSRLKLNNIQFRKKKGIKHTIRKTTITTEFFIDKITKQKDDFDYFLGIFASDGNVYKNMVRIGGISDENVEFLQHWCSFLDNKVSIKRRLRSNKTSFYNDVVFKNQDIVDLLSEDYGVTPNKTFTIILPYINWNVIRGLFDGDGCLVKDLRCNSWKFEIVSASTLLANQIYDFYITEGLNAHIYKDKNLYKITIHNKKDISILFYKLYKDCSYFLKRKYDKFLPIIQKTE